MDIFEAARKGDITFIKDYKGDVNAVTKDGWTALMYAASEGQMSMVRALIAANANVNIIDENGNTALSFSILYKHSGITNLLKTAGAK